jgi:hypothetical protein
MLPLRHLNWFSARSMLYFLLPKRLRCGIETAWFPHSPRLCSHNLRVNYCCNLLFYLCRCNAILKVLYFRQSAYVSCFVLPCLLPESTPNKMLESMDLLRVSTQHLYRQVNRVMTRSLLRKVCLITTVKSGSYFLLRYLKTPKEHTAIFYVMPHSSLF